MRQFIRFAVVGAFVSALVAIAPRVVAAETRDVSTSAEISELKKGQEALRKEIDEIKRQLTALSAAPPRFPAVEKIDAVITVGDIKPKGQKNAPLTLIEFSDYQCPFCARHVAQTLPHLMKAYVDTGKLRYVFRDYPLEIHANAAKAAEAARCAGDQNKYWEMHDKLFANQNQLELSKLPGYAKAIGLNESEFERCLNKGKHTRAVKKDMEQANALGVRGTPAMVLGVSDGDKVKDAIIIRGARPLPIFTAEIEKLLAAQGAAKK